MSSATALVSDSVAVDTRTTPRNVTWMRVLHSEWGKLWSLRSTWITLGVALLFLVGFGFLASLTFDPAGSPPGAPPRPGPPLSDAVAVALSGTNLAQLAIGVVGVLFAAGEYTTGMIRSTLAAVPKRWPVLSTKAVVFGASTFVIGVLGAIAAFLVSSGPLSDTAISVSLSDDGVLRALLGAGGYLALVGVLGVALGLLLRSSAGGIAVLVGALLIVPGLAMLLPDSWSDVITPYLPSNAGSAMMALSAADDSLTPGAGLAVLLGWAAAALLGAAWRMVRSDA